MEQAKEQDKNKWKQFQGKAFNKSMKVFLFLDDNVTHVFTAIVKLIEAVNYKHEYRISSNESL